MAGAFMLQRRCRLLASVLAAGGLRCLGSNCPSEGSVGRSVDGGVVVKVDFLNSAEDAAVLYWVDRFGEEKRIDEVSAGASRTMNSFAGHVWRVRSSTTERLLAEEAMAADLLQRVTIQDCDDGKAAAVLTPEQVAEEQSWLAAYGQRQSVALRGCPVSLLLSEIKLRGFHVICAVSSGEDAPRELQRLCIFTNGLDSEVCSASVNVSSSTSVQEAVVRVLARIAPKWRIRPRAPEPALFTASGRRLPSDMALEDVGVPSYRQALVLVEGGEWHWPPVKVGFERPLSSFIHGGITDIKLTTLSLKPRIFQVKSFIKDEECNHILKKAGPKVRKSGVVIKDADIGKEVDEWRTSENMFLPSDGDPILEAFDERVQNLTRIPIVNSEYAQILKYEYRGRYKAHTDYFDPKDYQKDPNTISMTANGVWNRLLTVFMYLSDVESGGETVFPSHGGKPSPHDFGACEGLKVKPERQKVIIFYDMHPNGDLDPDSLHGGCRVWNGTKWSANFWLWNVKMGYKASATAQRMAASLTQWEEHRDRAEERGVQQLFAELHGDKAEL